MQLATYATKEELGGVILLIATIFHDAAASHENTGYLTTASIASYSQTLRLFLDYYCRRTLFGYYFEIFLYTALETRKTARSENLRIEKLLLNN